MSHFSLLSVLLPAVLIASCSSAIKAESHNDKEANRVQEVVSDQAQLGFWGNPNMDYVTVENKINDNDLLIWDVPLLKEAKIDIAPMNRNDGLIVGELGIDGGDQDMIVKLAREIADGQHDKIDSLLIAHKDKLLFESYYLHGRINLTHPQASATKSYTGLALGRAIQLGYLTMADLDKPLVSFFNDLDPTKFVEGVETITLHQALTMRGGLRISDDQREEFDENPNQIHGHGLIQTLFEQSEPITAESHNFSYGNYNPPLVMQVIEAVVPGSAENFIKNELLDKMGITTYSWQRGLSGLPAAGWKASFSSRDMVKFGTVVMNKGKWDGEQIIPEAFIAKLSDRLVTLGQDDIFFTGENVSKPGYGFLFWQADLKVSDKSYYSSSAQGGGGQYIIVVEELDLIIVATGHERRPSTLQLTAERILPAFTK